jgi:hypothetical protein
MSSLQLLQHAMTSEQLGCNCSTDLNVELNQLTDLLEGSSNLRLNCRNRKEEKREKGGGRGLRGFREKKIKIPKEEKNTREFE